MAEARTTERPGGLRDLGLRIGTLPTGPANAITDVGDVAVGHVTVVRDEPGRPAGRGVARTGVTAIAPRAPGTLLAAPAPAGAAVLNGAGEMTGFLQVSEWGLIETPVYLTSTMAVGRVFDGAVAAAAAADPAVRDQVVIPVVAECDDSWLNEPIPVQVEADDAGRALATATGGPVAQGAVGAGTGMICFGWKGGIGTSSRVVEDLGATVGVLVLANFGAWRDLRIDGVPVGRLLGAAGEGPAPVERTPAGSCIAVVATDAPLGTAQLERVARRAGLGLARTGSVAHHGSGEIFIAFAAGARDGTIAARSPDRPGAARERVGAMPDSDLDPIFAATVDAAEEGGPQRALGGGGHHRARRANRSRAAARRRGRPADHAPSPGPLTDGTRVTRSGRAARVRPHGWRARAEDTRVIAAVLCSTWGLMFIVQRLALEESPPLWVAAGRASVAAVVLLPWAGRLRTLSRHGLGVVVVLGLLNQFLFIGLQAAGLKTVGAGPAAAIIYLQPVLVVVASGPVLGERLTPRRIVAALLGFAGVAVVGLHQSAEASAGGVLLLLGASVSWTAGALITSASDEPIVALVVGQHLVGAPLLVMVAGITEPFPTLSAKLVSCILFAGICGSAMAWMLWSALLRRGEASVVSTWLFAVPVLAAALGVVFLDEPLSLALIVGIALVAVAVRLAAAAPSRDRAPVPAAAARS